MHAAVFAFVASCWLLAGLVVLFRKRHAGLREVKRDPAWKIGLLLQSLGVLIIWASPRPRFTPILPLGIAVEVALALVPLGLAAGAVWLLLAAKRALGRQFAYQARLVDGHELVTTGAYGLVRHPMYTAVLAMTLATGLAWSHWIGLAAGLALAWIGTIVRTRIEDRLLRGQFGAQFDAYARGVPALIPRPGSKASTNRRPASSASP